MGEDSSYLSKTVRAQLHVIPLFRGFSDGHWFSLGLRVSMVKDWRKRSRVVKEARSPFPTGQGMVVASSLPIHPLGNKDIVTLVWVWHIPSPRFLFSSLKHSLFQGWCDTLAPKWCLGVPFCNSKLKRTGVVETNCYCLNLASLPKSMLRLNSQHVSDGKCGSGEWLSHEGRDFVNGIGCEDIALLYSEGDRIPGAILETEFKPPCAMDCPPFRIVRNKCLFLEITQTVEFWFGSIGRIRHQQSSFCPIKTTWSHLEEDNYKATIILASVYPFRNMAIAST